MTSPARDRAPNAHTKPSVPHPRCGGSNTHAGPSCCRTLVFFWGGGLPEGPPTGQSPPVDSQPEAAGNQPPSRWTTIPVAVVPPVWPPPPPVTARVLHPWRSGWQSGPFPSSPRAAPGAGPGCAPGPQRKARYSAAYCAPLAVHVQSHAAGCRLSAACTPASHRHQLSTPPPQTHLYPSSTSLPSHLTTPNTLHPPHEVFHYDADWQLVGAKDLSSLRNTDWHTASS